MQRSELSGLSSRICVRREDCFIWPREGFTSRTLGNGIGLQETRGNWVGKTLNQCMQLERQCRERGLMAWNDRAGPEACCLSEGKGCRGKRGFLPERPRQEERRTAVNAAPCPLPGLGLPLTLWQPQDQAFNSTGFTCCQESQKYYFEYWIEIIKYKCCIFDRSI